MQGAELLQKLNLQCNSNNPEAEGGEGISPHFHKPRGELIEEQKTDADLEPLYTWVGANSSKDIAQSLSSKGQNVDEKVEGTTNRGHWEMEHLLTVGNAIKVS